MRLGTNEERKQSKKVRCAFSQRQALTSYLYDKISKWSMFDAAEGSHKNQRGVRKKSKSISLGCEKEQEDVRQGKEQEKKGKLNSFICVPLKLYACTLYKELEHLLK